MHNKKRNEIGEKLIELFNNIKHNQVIVEGKRDKIVLKSFEFTKIITIGRGLYEVTTKIKGHVIILTDFDKEGKLLNKRLTQLLQSQGTKVDINIRNRISKSFTQLKIRTIEELKSLR